MRGYRIAARGDSRSSTVPVGEFLGGVLLLLLIVSGFLTWGAVDVLFGTSVLDWILESQLILFPLMLVLSPPEGLRGVGALLVLFAPAAIGVVAVYGLFIWSTSRASNACASSSPSLPLSPLTPSAKAHFFYTVFNITPEHASALSFDGEYFFVYHQMIHYRDVRGLELLPGEIVANAPASAPHVARYLHSCLNGSPDLRFRNNRVVSRTARRCELQLTTLSGRVGMPYWMHPSDDAWTRAREGVERLRRLIVAAAAFDVEGACRRFEAAAAEADPLSIEDRIELKSKIARAESGRDFCVARLQWIPPAAAESNQRDLANYEAELERLRGVAQVGAEVVVEAIRESELAWSAYLLIREQPEVT